MLADAAALVTGEPDPLPDVREVDGLGPLAACRSTSASTTTASSSSACASSSPPTATLTEEPDVTALDRLDPAALEAEAAGSGCGRVERARSRETERARRLDLRPSWRRPDG